MMLNAAEFEAAGRPILDVRSPGEYAQGHIPGAISFPLFTDQERAKVGTLYKQSGKEAAFLEGLKIVGPKMAFFVKEAGRIAVNGRIAVHCWRGGKRSGSMAWLFQQAGLDVVTLIGGYKQWRQEALASFRQKQWKIRIVGGRTGSGKTKILHALGDAGQQIIDLEAIAHHKGSAFGFIGEKDQPTVEQFENELYAALRHIDHQRVVWIENESRSIGRVFIPDGFWAQMKQAPLFNIAIPDEARLDNLIGDYVLEHREQLEHAFAKIASKLGGLQHKQAVEAVREGNFRLAASIALKYYDKTYQHCLDNNISPQIRQLSFEQGDPEQIAAALIQMESGILLK